MRTLIVALVLCAFAYAQRCPKTSKITKQDIDKVNTVALVTVTDSRKKVYDLMYEMYYPVKSEPSRWEAYKTINLNKCADVTLEQDISYVLGCKNENKNCRFIRRYNDVTPEEWALLKKKSP
ncbi:hypothetical protein Aduo_009974 [Ancylostoma duodenale]